MKSSTISFPVPPAFQPTPDHFLPLKPQICHICLGLKTKIERKNVTFHYNLATIINKKDMRITENIPFCEPTCVPTPPVHSTLESMKSIQSFFKNQSTVIFYWKLDWAIFSKYISTTTSTFSWHLNLVTTKIAQESYEKNNESWRLLFNFN